MKQTKAIILLLMGLVLFTACPDPDPEPEPEPQTFQRSLQLSAESGQQTYTATDLKAGISDIQNTSSWLTVTPMAYGSGSPKVQLTYEKNTGGERSAVVTLTDVNDNKVFLTVTQVKAEEAPVNPENPESPDKPDNPDSPDKPDSPDSPDNPDNPDNPPYVPQTYQQTVSFDSWEAGSQSVRLNDLNNCVEDIAIESAWLTVKKESYTNGSPSVELTATANDDTQQRTATATITAENGDKVVLTVTQAGRIYGIDDPHNTETDQPAYSHRQW